MLSILCVSDVKHYAVPFIEEMDRVAHRLGAEFVLVQDGKDVHSAGYIESVLDEAIAKTKGDYILRLDDDEKCSPALIRFLDREIYRSYDHWSFPRAHLWGNPKTMILEKYYWPDVQTRLSVRAKSGGRDKIHVRSPFGAGRIPNACLEHWCYLAKTYEERLEVGRRYHRIHSGADGGEFRATSFEDERAGQEVQFIEYTDGTVTGAMDVSGHTVGVPFRDRRIWKAAL
jgi:hypothetical protein